MFHLESAAKKNGEKVVRSRRMEVMGSAAAVIVFSLGFPLLLQTGLF